MSGRRNIRVRYQIGDVSRRQPVAEHWRGLPQQTPTWAVLGQRGGDLGVSFAGKPFSFLDSGVWLLVARDDAAAAALLSAIVAGSAKIRRATSLAFR